MLDDFIERYFFFLLRSTNHVRQSDNKPLKAHNPIRLFMLSNEEGVVKQ